MARFEKSEKFSRLEAEFPFVSAATGSLDRLGQRCTRFESRRHFPGKTEKND
jgi:hypothetical protein